MDIKAYISSGILELYALDQLSPSERLEVEANMVKYPALKEELQKIETSLFGYIASFAKDTPPGLDQKIMDRLEDKQPPATSPAQKVPSAYKNLYWLLGALVLAAIAALYFMNQSFQSQQKGLQEQLEQQIADCDEKEEELQLLRNYFEIANDPNYQSIAMNGTDSYPGFAAEVFTAPTQQLNFISVKNMPQLSAAEQFQLWGIVDGNPVSLGVFDLDANFTNAMVAVQFVNNPQAFAVTIEPKGGSETPTLEKMVVLGNV